jgi:tetratricopeptide (TPR) repeat protein
VAGRLKRVAEEFPNTAVALWARLDLADHLVFDGRDKLTKDREIGIAQFKEAQQAYAAVLASPHVLPDMVRRAAIAEAKCFELMGDREKAIEAYRAAAKKYAATLPGVAKDAERLAAELARPEAADFYKWLAEYEPPTSPGAASDLAFPPTMPGGSSEPSSEKPTLGDSPDSSESKSENDVPDSEKKTSSDPATKPADTSEKPTQPPATNKDSDPSSSDRKEPTPANPGDAPAKPDGANKPPVPTEPKD